MKRKRRAAAPLRRGPAVLLGDGCLLLLVLAGTVFSFLTAFSVQIPVSYTHLTLPTTPYV